MKRVCRKVVALALVLAMAFAYLPQGVVNVKAADDVTFDTSKVAVVPSYEVKGPVVVHNNSSALKIIKLNWKCVCIKSDGSSWEKTDAANNGNYYSIEPGASETVEIGTGYIDWKEPTLKSFTVTAEEAVVKTDLNATPIGLNENGYSLAIKGVNKYKEESYYTNQYGNKTVVSSNEYIGFEYVNDAAKEKWRGITVNVEAYKDGDTKATTTVVIDPDNPKLSFGDEIDGWIKANQLWQLKLVAPLPKSNAPEVKMTNASVSGTKLTYTATNNTDKYITSFTYKSSAGTMVDNTRWLAPKSTSEITYDFGEAVIGIELSEVTTFEVSTSSGVTFSKLDKLSPGFALSYSVDGAGDYKITTYGASGAVESEERTYTEARNDSVVKHYGITEFKKIVIEKTSGCALYSDISWITPVAITKSGKTYSFSFKNTSTVAKVNSMTVSVEEDGVAKTVNLNKGIAVNDTSDTLTIDSTASIIKVTLKNITAETTKLANPGGSGSLSASDVYTEYDGTSWIAYYTIKNNDTKKAFDSFSVTLTIAGSAFSDTNKTFSHSKSLKAGKSSKFSQTLGSGTDYIYVKAFGIGDATEGEVMPTYDSKLDDTGVHERDENGKKYAQWSCVELGSYKGSPIVWRIVKNSGGIATLVADQAIVDCPFATNKYAVNWEDSAVRAYLNGDFITEAGLDSVGLMEVTLDTPVNSTASSTKPTACTTADKVSIPSIEELCMFGMWGTKDALVGTIGTRQMERGDSIASSKSIALDKSETYCDYMLRNSGYYSWNVSYVTSQGKVNVGGCPTYSNALGVVPVIRVSSSSLTKTAPGRVVKLQSDPAKTSADDIVKTGKRSSTLSKLGLAAYGTKKTIKKVTYTVTSDIEEDSELPADVVGGAIANGRTVAITGVKKGAKSITIPSTVTIAGETFKVTSIDGKAFKKAKKTLKSIKINADTLEYVDSDAFKGLGKSTTIKTNASNYSKVKKAVKSSKAKAKVKK